MFVLRHVFKNFGYMLLMAGGFYLITIWNNWWASMLIYLVFMIGITYLLFHKDVNKLCGKLFTGKENNNDVIIPDCDTRESHNESTKEQ